MKTVLVHGFLGTARDWGETSECECLSLFQRNAFDATHSFEHWSQNFLEKIHQPVVAMGYSLGGRLLAHAFHKNPNKFEKLILISSYPFQLSEEQKQSRFEFDLQWQKIFLDDDWENVISSWNALSVFNGSKHHPVRREVEYDRQLLSLAFKNWSPALQSMHWQDLQSEAHKISFYVGSEDNKYLKIANRLKQENSGIKIVEINGQGHRMDLNVLYKSILREEA